MQPGLVVVPESYYVATEAEMALLGALLLRPQGFVEIAGVVTESDFLDELHRRIFNEAQWMYDCTEAVDLVMLRARLGVSDDSPEINACVSAMESVPSATNAYQYAKIVRDAAKRRMLGHRAMEIARATKNEPDFAGVLALVDGLASLSGDDSNVARHISQIDSGAGDMGLTTTYPELDLLISTGGFPLGQTTIARAYHKGGKCWGIGTPILMSDGSVKSVEDIEVGDFVMAPDSTKSKVLSLARGRGELYRISPNKGDAWTCNGDHILVLKNRQTGRLIEESVDDFLQRSPQNQRDLRMMRVGFDAPAKDLPVDPYIFGLWLGDGHTGVSRFTFHSSEVELADALSAYASSSGLRVRVVWEKGSAVTFSLSKVVRGRYLSTLGRLIKSASIGGKHIPEDYMTGSRDQRLALLAGLVDTDGSTHHNGFDITLKHEFLSKQIVRLANGLGLYATTRKRTCSIKSSGFSGEYWRTTIYGATHDVPVRLERKRATLARRRNRGQVTFSVEHVGVGDYYGFTLDGSGQLLLGDGTITHNTTFMMSCALRLALRGRRVLYATFADLSGAQLRRRWLKMLCGWSVQPDSDGLAANFTAAVGKLDACDLVVYDTARSDRFATVEAFSSWVRGTHEIKPYDAVFVDYAQKVKSVHRDAMYDQVLRGQVCSTALSDLAARTGLPVIVGSQVTKGGRESVDITKGSRGWEEDAGWVLGISTPENEPHLRTLSSVWSRFGLQGVDVTLRFNDERVSFE